MKKIPYVYDEMTSVQRLVAVAYSVYYQTFKFVWVVFATFLVNIMCGLTFFGPKRLKKFCQYIFANFWARGLLYGSMARYKITIDPSIDFKKTYLFVGNHSSSLDIYLWQTAIPKFFNWLAKRGLFNIPVLGSAMFVLDHIPVYRDDDPIKAMRSVRKAIERLKSGISVGVFPEGTRSKTGELQNFKKGAFLMAKAAKVPIIPVVMKRAFYIAPPKKLLWNPFMNMEIKLLSPMDSSDKEIQTKLKERIEEELRTDHLKKREHCE